MTAAILINGREIARLARAKIAADVAQLKVARGITPALAVIVVGDDPASHIYVENKHKAAQKAGMTSHVYKLPEQTPAAEVAALVQKLNADPAIHGILVQLPLPAHIPAGDVLPLIDPAKDVDGLHPVNIGRFMAGLPAHVPCTPLGCLLLLKSVCPDLAGLHAVVVGRSSLVGKPMTQLLLSEDCTVTQAHSRTRDLAGVTKQADILVAATGQPGLITGDMVKPGAIVLDVGITRQGDKITGDVDFDSVKDVAGYLTPVPGGVGPMTIAALLQNTLNAAQQK